MCWVLRCGEGCRVICQVVLFGALRCNSLQGRGGAEPVAAMPAPRAAGDLRHRGHPVIVGVEPQSRGTLEHIQDTLQSPAVRVVGAPLALAAMRAGAGCGHAYRTHAVSMGRKHTSVCAYATPSCSSSPVLHCVVREMAWERAQVHQARQTQRV